MRFAALMVVTAFAAVLSNSANAQTAAGTMERITVHGPALEGRLDGDSPDRDVFVYLPPGYGTDTGRRYPIAPAPPANGRQS